MSKPGERCMVICTEEQEEPKTTKNKGNIKKHIRDQVRADKKKKDRKKAKQEHIIDNRKRPCWREREKKKKEAKTEFVK